jgi:2,4-dienoyl-CoA reductase-like NADH-dependent reductase (Old Yellow Enzyme family)
MRAVAMQSQNSGISTATGLFEPVRVAGIPLRNRIAMAPMTREMSPGGVPGTDVVAYYRARAAGGTGLVIGEGAPPNAIGAFGASVPRFYGEDALGAWRDVVTAVHAEGAAFVPQLWHVGAFEPSSIGMADSLAPVERVSPSGLAAPGKPLGRAMDARDIDSTIEAFAAAAAAAKAIGCDGIEIHAAHGYLVDQFFWPGTNRRDDRYGARDRTRFAVELIGEVRRRVGSAFPILLRFSQWKQLDYAARLASTPAELEALLLPLAEAGVDIFHCSTRRYWEPAFDGEAGTLSGWTKRVTGRPTIMVGSVSLGTDFKAREGKLFAAVDIDDFARLEALLDAGEFDLVAIGRALIANPDWVTLVSSGRADALRPFDKIMLEHL